MTYEQLADFVHHRVRMSHVYQPVMLVALLQQGGRCSTTEITRSILAHGQSQIEYYEDVTKNMVGRVLRNHGFVENEDSSYSLVGYEDLGDEQVLDMTLGNVSGTLGSLSSAGSSVDPSVISSVGSSDAACSSSRPPPMAATSPAKRSATKINPHPTPVHPRSCR
jgi:hypothetical protein